MEKQGPISFILGCMKHELFSLEYGMSNRPCHVTWAAALVLFINFEMVWCACFITMALQIRHLIFPLLPFITCMSRYEHRTKMKYILICSILRPNVPSI